VLLSWFVIAVGLVAGTVTLGSRASNGLDLPNSDSQKAVNLLTSRFPAQSGDTDQIVFHTRSGKLTDAPIRADIDAMLVRVAHLPHITGVVSPYAPGAGAMSKDGTIGFASVGFDQAANALSDATANQMITTAESARSGTLQVEFGGAAADQVNQGSVGSATAIGLIAAMVVLLLSFGSLLAMGLPIITAVIGLAAGVGTIGLVSRIIQMADFSTELALMIGLGVGIDYALFIVTRFREVYRRNGENVQDAIEVAMNTAGRAIIFAGVTVVIAILGMLALGVSLLSGVAIAAALGVLVVLVASLTLLPALLKFTGKRVGRVRRSEKRPSSGTFWVRWVNLIQRRAGWAAAGATVVMLALATPALGLRIGTSDAGTAPVGNTTRAAYDLLATDSVPDSTARCSSLWIFPRMRARPRSTRWSRPFEARLESHR
jgi:RND superfamily putative drug exporter